MRKKIRFRSLASSVLFTLGCLAAAAYFTSLFWRDLNAYTARSDKQAVATVTFKNRVAQRKFDDRVVWERISQNAPLYDGDTISTADGSEATLHFSDGTKLDLYENTMVKLALTEDGALDLSVSGGDIQVDTKDSTGAANVSVSLGDGSKVALQKGSVVSVARGSGQGGTASVAVQDGGATVTGADGGVSAVTGGQAVSVTADGAIQKQSIAVLYPPKELSLLVSADDTAAQEVRVSWNVGGISAGDNSRPTALDATARPVIVQTSGAKDFSVIASEQTVTDGDGTAILVAHSPLYWRVIDAGAAGSDDAAAAVTAVASGRITVERLSRVALSSPADATVFRYKGEVPAVTLRWGEVPFAVQYTVTVSQNADLSAPVFAQTVSVPFVPFEPAGVGTYYWRVEPHLSRAVSFPLESDIACFTLEQTEAIADVGVSAPVQDADSHATAESPESAGEETAAEEPSPEPPAPAALSRPYLLSPRYNLVMDNSYLRSNRSIYFSWQRVSGAASYTFTLSKIEGRSRRQILSRTVTGTSLSLYDFSILSEGSFEWSVTASPGAQSTLYLRSPAATSMFSIRLASPDAVDVSEPEGVYGN